jgi:hypothetical protein
MPSNETDTKLWIDKHISTEGTDFGGDEKLKLLVKKFMTHDCSQQTPSNPTGCLRKGKCRKRFDLNKECLECKFDENGYPIYKRKGTDLNVVSCNKKILMDWDGHANLCFTEHAYTINYLYGYIFKGNKKVKAFTKTNSGSSWCN